MRCDVACREDLENALEYVRMRFGSLDVVLNNAGIGGTQDLDRITAVNVGGVVHGERASSSKHMARGGVETTWPLY